MNVVHDIVKDPLLSRDFKAALVKSRNADVIKMRQVLGRHGFRAVIAEKPFTEEAQIEISRRISRCENKQKAIFSAVRGVIKALACGWYERTHWKAYEEAEGSLVYLLPYGDVHARLDAFREKTEIARLDTVRRIFSSLLKGTSAGEETVVRLCEEAMFDEVSARAWHERSRDQSMQCRPYRTRACFVVGIPFNYEASVVGPGLQTVHGLPTLAALRVDTGVIGEKVWRARWASKGPGVSLKVEDGFIVKRGRAIAHGCSLVAARASLRRSVLQKNGDRHDAVLFARIEADKLVGDGQMIISVHDLCSAGFSPSEAAAFWDGLFPGEASVPVVKLLAATKGRPERPVALLACFLAIRGRQKMMMEGVLHLRLRRGR